MEKKSIELSGIIKLEYNDGWNKIKLIQPDGYRIDLVNRFQELMENFPKEVQVSYYLSDTVCTKNEMVAEYIKKIHGSLDANYEKHDYCYSSWTSGTDYNTNLSVGKHNLVAELMNEEDRFIIFEINYKI